MNQHRCVVRSYSRVALPLIAGLLVAAGDAPSAHAAGTPIKVACIGEQTTHSDLFPIRNNQPVGMQEYPAMLQTLLGSGYNVMNFGDCCASVISGYTTSETHPYISGNQFGPSQSFAPDIVIIGSWGRHDWGMSAQNALAAFKAGDTTTEFTKFQTDYDTLVSKYIALSPKPKIFCSTPIPIPFGMDGPDDGYKTSPAAAAITAVCQKYGLSIIDLFTAFTGHMEYYINPPDKDSEGEHNSTAGAQEMAQLAFDAITGADAGGIVVSGGSGGEGGAPPGSGDDASTGSSGGLGGTGSSSGAGQGSSSGGGQGSSSGSGLASSAGSSGGGVSAGTATGSSSGSVVAYATPDAGGASANAAGTTSDTSGSSGGGGGCSTAPWSGPTRWTAAVFTVFGWALLARRRNRRRSPHAAG